MPQDSSVEQALPWVVVAIHNKRSVDAAILSFVGGGSRQPNFLQAKSMLQTMKDLVVQQEAIWAEGRYCMCPQVIGPSLSRDHMWPVPSEPTRQALVRALTAHQK